MAYVVGFFAADGSMLTNKRGAHFVEFTVVDGGILKQIKRAVGSNHCIAARERGGNCRTAYRLQIGSKEWFGDLTRLGFTQRKSRTLRYPRVPDEFFGDFVRGYFDGDGCVYFKQCWSKSHGKRVWVLTTIFTSGSKMFLEQLHAGLRTRGLAGGHVAAKQRGWALVFSRHDSLALFRLMYHTAHTPNLFLSRKRKKLERAIKVLGLSRT